MKRGKNKQGRVARMAGAWLPYTHRKTGITVRFEHVQAKRYAVYRLGLDVVESVVLTHTTGFLLKPDGSTRQTERVMKDWATGWICLLGVCRQRMKAGFTLVSVDPSNIVECLQMDLPSLNVRS